MNEMNETFNERYRKIGVESKSTTNQTCRCTMGVLEGSVKIKVAQNLLKHTSVPKLFKIEHVSCLGVMSRM